jgi:hypothetical protein
MAACSGDDSAPIGFQPSATASVARPEAVPATATADTSTPTPVTSSPASTAGTAQSAGAAPATSATPMPGDRDGVPFSTLDVRRAVQDGHRFSFWRVDDRTPLCPASAAPGLPYWSANLAGSDFGPVWVLWVYPDVDALQRDWETIPGDAPRSRIEGCELPTGFVYWNKNLIMTFAVWLSLGEELPLERHYDSPGEHPAVRGFLGLMP